MRHAAEGSEAIVRTRNLPGRARVAEFDWVSPDDSRQWRPFTVTRRQVERERKVDSVFALVSDELFLDPAQLRRRVREVRQSLLVASRRANEVIRRRGLGFVA